MKTTVRCFLLLVLADGILGKMADCTSSIGQDHVLVTVEQNENGICGGSLISSEWVLTAAHCNATNLSVKLGKEERREVIGKKQFSANSKLHNIMLLNIKKASNNFNVFTKLPDSNQCKTPSSTVQFYSWIDPLEDLENDKEIPQKLKCAELKVKTCQEVPEEKSQMMAMELEHTDHKLFCTEANEEECDWYEGGSLVLNDVLHGILINYDLSCKIQLEFLDLCHYRTWIKNVSGV